MRVLRRRGLQRHLVGRAPARAARSGAGARRPAPSRPPSGSGSPASPPGGSRGSPPWPAGPPAARAAGSPPRRGRRGRRRSPGRGACTGARCRAPSEAATLRATSLPCRCACCAVIAVRWPGRVRSGTAAASPQANTSGWPGTRMNSSTTTRPFSVCSPRLSTSGSGRTPTHQTSVRVATSSPVVSRTPSCPASSTDTPIRTSTPRSRSTRSAVADRRSSSSGSTRSAMSRSIQRTGWSRSSGCAPRRLSVSSTPCAATSVPV